MVASAGSITGNTGMFTREQCLAAARAYARERRAEIRRRHEAGDSGTDVVHMLSEMADEMLHGVFQFALNVLPSRRTLLSRVALCALGGYGRGEMSPYSDLDVCVLYDDELDENVKTLNSYLVPFLWDTGFDVGHSILSVPHAVELARSDLKAFTSLLQARLIAGDSTVWARLKLSIRELQGARAAAFLAQKTRERYDGLAPDFADLYDPEPNIKENAGGLRDYHTALWLFMMAYGVTTLDEAESQGLIRPEEHLEFIESIDFLRRVRNEMHFHSRRQEDRLTYAMQRHVASAFGYGSSGAPDMRLLMQDYYRAARRTRRLLSTAAYLCRSLTGPEDAEPEATIRPNIQIRAEQLYAGESDTNWFAHSPPRLMEVFWRAAQHRVPLSRETETKVTRNLHLVTDVFQSGGLVRRYFLGVCGRLLEAGRVLRQMAQSGLLSRYIPEFRQVQNVIRYEDFHSYPVDEHTLRAIEALAAIPGMEGPIGRCLREALEHLSDPHILVLAILFHDLGKARGDVHVEESVRLTRQVCERMQLPQDDLERVAFLVQHHILMTEISQYRDTDDEHIVGSFTDTMGSEQRLRALFLLSYADLSAVGPGVWNDWKGTLLMQLYLKAMKRLTGRAETVGEAFWRSQKARQVHETLPDSLLPQVEEHLRDLGPRYFVAFTPDQIAMHLECIVEAQANGLAVRHAPNEQTGMSDVVISTRDRTGLFATIAGTFSSQLIDVHGAALFTRPDGWVIDSFTVRDARQGRPLTENQARQVVEVLREVLLRGRDVAQFVEQSRRRLFALLQPRIAVPTRIEFDNSSARYHTVIDIETGDRTGLLYDITRAMTDAGLDISTARIATETRRVRDSFYVTLDGEKIVRQEDEEAVRGRIHEAIHPRSTGDKEGGSI